MAIRVLPVAAPLVSLLYYTASVVAQVEVTANCTSLSFSWTFNSAGQSPCTVAGYMMSSCYGASYTISPLPPGYVYGGPKLGYSNECICNTIVYSLLGACGVCQAQVSITWSRYLTNCSSIQPPSQFPYPVPGTYVPYWATLDLVENDNWDVNAAFRAGDRPEYGPGAIIGPSGVPTTSSSASFSVSMTSPSPSFTGSSSNSGGKSSNAGGVVGGVVAAIAAISIAAAIIFYLLGRRRRATFAGNAASRPISNDRAIVQSSSESPLAMRFYNPDDPTTFPGYQGDQRPLDIPSASEGPSSPHVASSGDTQTSLTHASGYHGLPMPMA